MDSAQLNIPSIANQQSFSQVPVDSFFYFEGMIWRKRSHRTAHIACLPNSWRYFSKTDMVE